MSPSARVTWRSFQAGALRMILPGLASLPFGIGFGVAAAQKGLSAFETTLMSFTVMAGTSQMVALDIWAQPLPLMALAVSVFVANLRYFVMGAALQPHLPHLPWWLQPPVWYVTVDQNWARQHRRISSRPWRPRQVPGRRLRDGLHLVGLDPGRPSGGRRHPFRSHDGASGWVSTSWA